MSLIHRESIDDTLLLLLFIFHNFKKVEDATEFRKHLLIYENMIDL